MAATKNIFSIHHSSFIIHSSELRKMDTPSFKEDHISQIPALQMLVNLGYTYLNPVEAERQRGGKKEFHTPIY